ncbi:hypothetical protein [Celeribacter indicus]|uniref:Uncharacterized protein n=1 Tax=Celeribacter indicus TaxID=1208324 RepID=A0A0B5DR64_9RHOB|nr:hypothetical protein [Celeribacter indicus]AJE46008.1 hypothetical protein P73_1293 [Celeribacter indicus]SDX32753.1 hypothetical protein SAMN05443573_1229 [Celeribacter indicus]
MEAQVIAFLILCPFALAFVYAAVHEIRRYKSEGRATYGLVYNEETGTTHVTGIAEGEEGYDPESYDPNDYSDPDISDGSDDDRSRDTSK